MSNRSFMEKLLDGVEVVLKPLGDVAEYSKTRIGVDLVNKENYVGVDNLLQNRAGKTESNYVPTDGSLIEYRNGDILIGNIRPYLKKIWHADRVGGTNGDVLVIRPADEGLNSRYLYQDKVGPFSGGQKSRLLIEKFRGEILKRGKDGLVKIYNSPLAICKDSVNFRGT